MSTYHLILLLICIAILAIHSWIAGRGLRRELNPQLRRDLTLAGADSREEVQHRLEPIVLHGIKIVLFILSPLLLTLVAFNAFAPRVSEDLIYGIFAFKHMAIAYVMNWIVLWWLSLRACRQNLGLSWWTEPIVFVMSAIAGLIHWYLNLPLYPMTLIEHPSGRNLIGVTYIVLLAAYCAAPFILYRNLLAAYAYKEE